MRTKSFNIDFDFTPMEVLAAQGRAGTIAVSGGLVMTHRRPRAFHTVSIVARDPANGDVGVAVASKSLAVGAAVPYARAGVGAVATQCYTNMRYGPDGLAMMADGQSAQGALDGLIARDDGRDRRQAGMVDAHGLAASYTGVNCDEWAGGRTGEGYACQGNVLIGAETLGAMAETFESAKGDLSDRLYRALSAGDAAGGEKYGKQSSALLVMREGAGYGGFDDALVNLRVDDCPEPLAELGRLLDLHHLYFDITPEAEKLAIDEPMVREFQAMMRRLGFYRGEADGNWDAATQAALHKFVGAENFEERIDVTGRTIDPPALDYLRDRFGS